MAGASENHAFTIQRSLQGQLPPCDSLVTEESDFPAIQGYSLPALDSGNVLVVNGQFFGDELARVDTVELSLSSAVSSLRLELFIENSPSSGFYHDLLFMEDPLDQFYLADTFCGGGAGGQSTCVISISNLAAGTYTIRMFSEGVASYQLQICADACTLPSSPDYSDLTSCSGSATDTGGNHKYKIYQDSFTAAVLNDNARLLIEGKYNVALPVSEATGSFFYIQSVHSVDGDRCSSSTYSDASLRVIGGSGNVLEAAFELDAVSLPSSVYSEIDVTTGLLRLCHRIQLYRGGVRAILMNRVETVVSTQINLRKDFNTLDSANIITEVPQALTAETALDTGTNLEVSFLNPFTEAELVSPITSGQSIRVRVDTSSGVQLVQLSDASVSTNAGKTVVLIQNGSPLTSEAVVGALDCESDESACEFTMTLPFQGFFDQTYVVQLSGTVVVAVGASTDRRLKDANENAGFEKAFLTLPGQASPATRRLTSISSSLPPLLAVAATMLIGFG